MKFTQKVKRFDCDENLNTEDECRGEKLQDAWTFVGDSNRYESYKAFFEDYTMNHYTDKHSGIRYSSDEIERNRRTSGRSLFERQLFDYGYNFCEKCKVNSSQKLDPAHIKSVDWCKKNSEIEMIWSLDNQMVLCRECHKEYDKLNIKP